MFFLVLVHMYVNKFSKCLFNILAAKKKKKNHLASPIPGNLYYSLRLFSTGVRHMSRLCSKNLGKPEEASEEGGIGAGRPPKEEWAFLTGIFVGADGSGRWGCKGWIGAQPRRALDVRSLKFIRSQDLSGWPQLMQGPQGTMQRHRHNILASCSN